MPLIKQKTMIEARFYHSLFCLATNPTTTGVPFERLLGHLDRLD